MQAHFITAVLTSLLLFPSPSRSEIEVCPIKSEFHPSAKIRILKPDHIAADQKLKVVYVLPVEPGEGNRFGDGLEEIKKKDLHNQWRAMFVAPSFHEWPWYADHPEKPEVRQETHFLKAVIPWVETNYPVQKSAEGRLLLGFSKSGWGAWSLLLRHPDLFHKAVAWDAPLMMQQVGKYGSGDVMGTQEQFEKYKITERLRQSVLPTAKPWPTQPRLILLGYGNFRTDHEQMHKLLNELKIPHVYRDGPARKHDWHSGWVAEAVGLLLAEQE